jgi:tetratricopeptide (TPR) repeat protein
MKYAVISAFLLFAGAAASAQDAVECRELVASVSPPLDEGEGHRRYLAGAAGAYRDCRGKKTPVDVRVHAIVKYALAKSTSFEGQTAVAALGEAIDVLDRERGDHAALLIEVLDHAVLVESQLLLRSEAFLHAKRAADVRAKKYGRNSAESAVGLVNLAIVYATFKDDAKAEDLMRQAVRIAEKACGPECDALALAYSGMETLYATRGKDVEARKYAELAQEAIPSRKRRP